MEFAKKRIFQKLKLKYNFDILFDVAKYLVAILIAILFLVPLYIVLVSSFKDQAQIMLNPFGLPKTFIFANYITGINRVGFFQALGLSLWITIASVIVIVLFTSMTAWIITRVKTKLSKIIYYAFIVSMIVPFQLVMFPLVYTSSNWFNLDNPLGIVLIYLGFGSGLSVFLFCGFIKSIPISIEEAAMIDGCNPIKTFFYVVVPLIKPILITVSILNVMWIWNDFLLPYRVLDISSFKTIPIAIQYLKDGYGGIEYGPMTALIVLSIIPIVIFYLALQKYIINGVIAGAVKG